MSQQKFFFILASFLLLLVTSGCRRDFSEIVLDDTCKPPCWRNYQIGMSTEEVLNKTLESNDYRIRYEEFNETTASVIIDNGNQGEITLRLDHGKLRGVRFGSFKGFWASSEDAFSYYGEPDYVLGHYLSGVFGGSSIFFCYTKQGVMLKSEFKMLNDQPSQNYPLTEKTKIVEILYYDVDNIPWSYNVYPCLKPTSKDYVSTDWHGYGEYSTCDPEEHNWCDR